MKDFATTTTLAMLLALGACGSSSNAGGASADSGPGGGTADAGNTSDAGTSSDAGTAPTGRYFPLAVGASWGYQVTNAGVTTGTKVQAVLALEDVGGTKAGITAYKVQSTKPSGKITISWQEDTGTSLIRHREQTFTSTQTQETEEVYMPSKLRLDESVAHLAMGASFDVTYNEHIQDFVLNTVTDFSKTETWTVEGIDVPVTVPAGTFSCIQLHKVNAVTGSDKRYWFSRGVGKVREESASQIEELTTFSMP